MGAKKELTSQERRIIFELRSQKYSYKRISGKFFIFVTLLYAYLEIAGIAKSTVIYTIKNYPADGDFKTKPRVGRPKKLSDRDMRAIVANLRRSPYKTSLELANEINCIRPNLRVCGEI